ncbi:MAG: serine/threonine protein kinase [Labilithrix sp.]|nr:serine/threonine protein kinase [Labilithrix sp.]MCW5816552.1 serine/threonine protein kinase [Labilithrix sp.]
MADLLISDELSDEPSDFGSLRPGTRLGRYELLVPIARGGMARVWAARQHGQRGFQKLVAIKTILPHLADEPEFEHMFLDEARIASGVHHPNVCEIYELGEEKRTLYLAMEWVNGDSFSRALRISGKPEPVEVSIAARIIADACAGAHAAHELEDDNGRKLGVVHRDLSPHNILINADGFTKVCDFGVAKALGQIHEQTSAGQLKGKISYMSPEQVTGDPVDRRSDVFSLGCVLYEATTGRRPFRGEGDHNVMQAIVNGQFESPAAIVRGYPPELERIIARALASVPNRRFASAELMRYALEEFLAKGPLVTQGHVGQMVKTRLAELLERRRERIKQASSSAESWDPASVPPSRMPADHRSGVKPSQSSGRLEPLGVIGPTSSSTIPQAPSAIAQMALGETQEVDTHADTHAVVTDSSNAAVIEEAILSSLVPNVPSPLDPPLPPSELPPRSVLEARALTAPARDVPIPILSPLSAGPPPSFEGPPSLAPRPGPVLEPAPESPPPALGYYAMAMLVGLLFAVVIGGAGLFYWRSRQQVSPAPVAASASAPSSGPSASAPSASVPPLTAASPEVLFRVSPADAVLVVDGKELPRDRRALPRPPAGEVSSVVIHAKGFEDSSVQLDYFSAPAIDVVLQPTADAGATTTKKKPRPRDKDPSAIPDNPY